MPIGVIIGSLVTCEVPHKGSLFWLSGNSDAVSLGGIDLSAYLLSLFTTQKTVSSN